MELNAANDARYQGAVHYLLDARIGGTSIAGTRLAYLDDETPPTARLKATVSSITEGYSFSVQIRLDRAFAIDQEIGLLVDDPEGFLKEPVPDTLRVPWGELSSAPQRVRTKIVSDNGENTTFTIALDPDSDQYVMGSDSSLTVQVLDNETVPGTVPSLTAKSGDGQVTLSWPAAPSNGTAIRTYQYRQREGQGAWNPRWNGSWVSVGPSATIHRTYTVQNLTNGQEHTFEVRAWNDSGGGTAASAKATPGSDEDERTETPSLTVAGDEAEEGADDAIGFVVTLSQSSSETVSVEYTTENLPAGSSKRALAGQDYHADQGFLTFRPGQTEKTVWVLIINDDVEDDGERFRLRLSNPSGATIANGTAIGLIRNSEETEPEAEPLTASFSAIPAQHDGSSEFTFTLTLSEEPDEDLSYQTLRDHAFEIAGGDVRKAKRQSSGSNVTWTIHLEPTGPGTVTMTLPATTDCSATGAICTSDGRKLSNSPSGTVPGPPAEPLTASLTGMPTEHDGENTFTFSLTFSEEPHADFSYRTLRDHAFEITGGAVRRAPRQQSGSNLAWTIHVEPTGPGAVDIRLPATTDCGSSGAVCTGDGRKLANSPADTVAGPAGLTAADATADENNDPTIDFTVNLDRNAASTVTVDYQTADGTATAGSDYTAANGTLSFGPGERTKTVSVSILQDSHDEGEETLVLRLSNASGAVITDDEATGTIENHDPMPRALLARFGRTAAVHVVEHVEERLQAPREPGFEGRFAGRELRKGMERDMALNFLRQLGGSADMHPAGMGSHTAIAASPTAGTAPLETPGHGGHGAGTAGGPSGLDGGLNSGGFLHMGLGGGDPLTGSGFAMNRESRGGILSFWTRGAQSRFSGREGALSLGGDVRTTMFGADYARGPVVAGLSLSNSRGLGEYAGVAGGRVASSVTGLYPWLGYKMTERVTVWGVAGYGTGGMLLTPQSGQALESGLSMAMAAAGTRGELVADGSSGFELAFKADALWVGTAIDGVDGPAGRLKATDAAITRFRTGLEGSRGYTLAGRLSLTPSVELGLRHDGGVAETGAGMDVGAGLVVSDAGTGLAVDVRVRTLLVHQTEDFSERGVAVSLSYNPTPSTPLGFLARVAPSWGGQAMSGAQALWGRETMAGMAHGGVAQGNSLDAELGYGLPVGSRFVGTPKLGLRTSVYGQNYRVGYGLGVLDRESLNFELGVEAQRRNSPMLRGTSNGVLGRATLGP